VAVRTENVLELSYFRLEIAVREDLALGLDKALARVKHVFDFDEAAGARELQEWLDGVKQSCRAARLEDKLARVDKHAALAAEGGKNR